MYSPKIVYSALRDIYREEVEALSSAEIKEVDDESPESRLAHHLMVLYAWGEIGTEKDGLIEAFFEKAPSVITSKALSHIGRDLDSNSRTEEPECIKRFKELWDWRLNLAGGIDKTPKKNLAAFGRWFASGKCGDQWAFERLEAVLKRTDIGESDLFVFRHMLKVFKDFPRESLRCLRLFIDHNQDQWFFGHKEEDVWKILEAALQMPGQEIKDTAEEIVHLLGSKGYLQYRELLKKETAWPEDC